MTGADSTPHNELQRLELETELDREFVSRAAGDEPMSENDRAEHDRLRQERGERFYADLLFVLTHITIESSRAAKVWHRLLAHKQVMSDALGRNVGIAVAALDYFSNIREDLDQPVVVDEQQLVAFAELGTRDTMTGLLDHATFHFVLRKEIKRAQRYDGTVSVIMLDVDHFKNFNDEHGHQAGDRVLKRIAKIMQSEAREVDWACRYGGEEFCLVAPNTAHEATFAFAERLRKRIKSALAADAITMSLGIASFPVHGATVLEVVSAADKALYDSKERGRDRTTASASEAAPGR